MMFSSIYDTTHTGCGPEKMHPSTSTNPSINTNLPQVYLMENLTGGHGQTRRDLLIKFHWTYDGF